MQVDDTYSFFLGPNSRALGRLWLALGGSFSTSDMLIGYGIIAVERWEV